MKSSASEPDLSVVIYDCPLILVPGASILFVSVADREPWLGSRTCGRLHSRGKKRREKWRIQQQNVSWLHEDFYFEFLIVARISMQ